MGRTKIPSHNKHLSHHSTSRGEASSPGATPRHLSHPGRLTEYSHHRVKGWRQKAEAQERESEEKEAAAKKAARRRSYEEKCEAEWDAREVPEDKGEAARKEAEWFRVHEKLYTFEVQEKMAASLMAFAF